MQEPQLIINWLAIITSTVAAFILGGIWYGPLFGKKWAVLMGMDFSKKPDSKMMKRAMALQFFGLLLTSYVLAHTGQVWRPSVWGVGADGGSNLAYGFFCGFFTWIGFYIPLQLGKISWENRPWKLFLINSGHDFFTLQIIAQILAHWR